MKGFNNIDKSFFRKGQYVGYAGGRLYRIKKSGFGYWDAISQTLPIDSFKGKTLEDISAMLHEKGKAFKVMENNPNTKGV